MRAAQRATPRLPRLSQPQLCALRAILATGYGTRENLSGWTRGKYVKAPTMLVIRGIGDTFRWATSRALIAAGLIEPLPYGDGVRYTPTIVAHTVVALLEQPRPRRAP